MAFQFDDEFLRSLGLGGLPPEDRAALLGELYSELELRVGETLASGMSDDDLDQFTELSEHREGAGGRWLAANQPGYEGSAVFVAFLEKTAASGKRPSEDWLLSEYASLLWLERRRPDYRQVVAANIDALRDVVARHREQLLGPPDTPPGGTPVG